MPTKGPRRAHEAFTNQPASSHAPETDLDTSDTVAESGRLGGGWVSDGGVNVGLPNHDVPPDWLRQRSESDTDENNDAGGDDDAGGEEGELAGGGESGGGERDPERTYRGETVEVRCHHITGVREQANESLNGFNTPVSIAVDGHQVAGELAVQRHGRRVYSVEPAELSCDCGEDPCEHRQRAVEAVRALVNARRIRSAVSSWEQTRIRAAQRLAAAAAAETASRSREPRPESDGPSWSDDDNHERFQDEYEAARARQSAGEAPVPFMRENATGGLGDRNGGRGFGVEIEFDLDHLPNRSAALRAIGRDLHEAGLTTSPAQQRYHAAANSGYRNWSFEADSTVSGEIVSPVLYDEPHSWDELAQVCEIVKRHGGRATARTGGHVHVGCDDFDHTVENHNRLLAMAAEHEDNLYRLSHNPDRPAHRGLSWCSPNRNPSSGYRSIGQVRDSHRGHYIGLNFNAVRGTSTDHVEFRMWDGSLDPGVIQTQINLSLGMTDAAFQREVPVGSPEAVGSHRQANSHLQRGQRLEGEAWRDNTRSFRRLMDSVFWRESNKRQAAALFGVTRWQRSR